MFPYWLFFLIPAVAALGNRPKYGPPRRLANDPGWVFAGIGLLLVIGLRHDVGGDWDNYLRHIGQVPYMSWAEVLLSSEPAYWAINKAVVQSGHGIVLLNTLFGAVFTFGLVQFCRHLPRPWLALSVAMPYLVTVVAMGYTRQSVALGLEMLGLVALGQRRAFTFVFWILVAATFHRTVIVLLPLAVFIQARNRWIVVASAGVAAVLGYQVFLAQDIDTLVANYVDAEYQSAGALVRLGMNLMPALIFLLYRRQFVLSPAERRLWAVFSLVSVGLFALFFQTSASAALDRLALYCLPLQVAVFAHMPDILGRRGGRNLLAILAILLYLGTVLFVWLNFANNTWAWIPYRSYLFQ